MLEYRLPNDTVYSDVQYSEVMIPLSNGISDAISKDRVVTRLRGSG